MLRKWLIVFMMLTVATIMAACGESEETSTSTTDNQTASETAKKEEPSDKNTKIDELKVSFVPSKDPEQIITTTEPLKGLLKEELAKMGYDVSEVTIDVGTTYEAVGEALAAGTTDVGLIPGGTYVLYDDGAEVILTATRAALSNDSDQPKEWNDNKPTEGLKDKQATYYRSILIAGPTEKGQQLAAKVNNGEELTWEDLDSANWAVMSSSSSAGYIYPTLWMQDKYGKSLTDLSKVVQSDSYGSSFARLAAGQADVIVAYADARRDNEGKWTTDLGRTTSIWDETNVIGVTAPIYNDTVSVSKHSKIMDEKLKAAIQDAFINIAQTEEGKNVIAIYSHEGYQKATSADYDGERKAQELLKSLK
ncbi:PhnD/SsuA/transferrin family substrate-binding protein [Bacillus luteolus]|uniref:PhnD/SsuA/transferrin family substrate-binding protein n=1 Tax=Litchfieldia luteola TaxID=682179 RepID=A0ABR9QD70_9BACI|nr:PhnD/SsuA/transferrin family substrate-binding protein [Cytobacillus luteolus]MBE4906440.1 PhnD/SsuA/transferrin family substrate-binding protein [Cytobacillus luteolus]MBP1941227.1 phosphonate transport system substrate-binding protein [Cytobacillus luteolus]